MSQRLFQSKHNEICGNIQNVQELLQLNNCWQSDSLIKNIILAPQLLAWGSKQDREWQVYHNSMSTLYALKSLAEAKLLNDENCSMIFRDPQGFPWFPHPSYLSIIPALKSATPCLLTQTNLETLAKMHNADPLFFTVNFFPEKIIRLRKLDLLNKDTLGHLVIGHYPELIEIVRKKELNIDNTTTTNEERLEIIRKVVIEYLERCNELNPQLPIDAKITVEIGKDIEPDLIPTMRA